MKHNQQPPNAHLRKHWTRLVKTFYNQPAAKRRRQADVLRASPRPVELFRPVVRGQTIKYNGVQKLGSGFSLIELKEAGLNAQFAKTVGIAVDHRRRNNNQEELAVNVKRIKAYLSKLVLFPRVAGKPKNRVVKDSGNDVVAQPVTQNTNPEVITFQRTPKREKATVISKELRAKSVYRRLRQDWYNAKFVGVKERESKLKKPRNEQVEHLEKLPFLYKYRARTLMQQLLQKTQDPLQQAIIHYQLGVNFLDCKENGEYNFTISIQQSKKEY